MPVQTHIPCLLYTSHFHFDNVDNETIVPAGNIVLYRPKELQKYEYYGEDKTEVYWRCV